MRSTNPVLFAAFLLTACFPCAVHLYRNYAELEKDLRQKSSYVITPYVDPDSVAEIGYVYDMRRETHIREGRLNLVWFVAVPSENTRWSCSYENGFSSFKIGDGVTIIHKKSDIAPGDYTGYLIGLHDKQRSQATRVWALNEDELEMDSYSNN